MLGKYIKIYFWQLISILLNFGTLFVVTPFLSSNQSLFGIYTIIISLNIFLSYADLGFISAGLKYACESYAKGEREEETRIIGFVGFIFSIFVGVFMLVIFALAFDPHIIVSNLRNPDEIITARNLMLIVAISSPVFILQRVLQLVFAVRLEDYHFQRLLIISSIFKICSTFYFFRSSHYQIVEYFLFTQLCSILAMVAGLIQAKRRLNYDIKLLFVSFRYSRPLFDKTKKLAFSSILLTVCWVLYYQLDPFVIGRLAGAPAVAIYAIGLTLITYIRSLFGIFFAPFTARFNHYVGLGDNEGLKNVFTNVLVLTLPVTVFPVLCMAITTRELVMNWVGPDYLSSIQVAQFLILCYVFNFITSPAGILIMAYERVKMIYWTSAMLPLIYWIGIGVSWTFLGLLSFGIFKFVSFSISAAIYCFMSCRVLHIKMRDFMKNILVPAILPILAIAGLTFLLKGYIPVGHSKINLLYYIIINGAICLLGILIYFFSSWIFRDYMLKAIKHVRSSFSLKSVQNG